MIKIFMQQQYSYVTNAEWYSDKLVRTPAWISAAETSCSEAYMQR